MQKKKTITDKKSNGKKIKGLLKAVNKVIKKNSYYNITNVYNVLL